MDAKTTAAASIDDYIAAQASAVQPILQRIRAIVREEAPDAVEAVSYRMPAFMLGGALVYFGAFKKHIGIYLRCTATRRCCRRWRPTAARRATCRFRWPKPCLTS